MFHRLLFLGCLALLVSVSCSPPTTGPQDQPSSESLSDASTSEPATEALAPDPNPADTASEPASPPEAEATPEPASPDTTEQPPEARPEASCLPKTCAQLQAECGEIDDGCGLKLTCPPCKTNEICGTVTPNRCSARPPPVNCQPITQRPTWQLCQATPDSCAGIFDDSAGCKAFCAAVNLDCLAVYEDGPSCTKDTTRPALSCDTPTGHRSDYCECGKKTACKPNCQGKTCGPDSCGGSCGNCLSNETCDSGICKPSTTHPTEDCSKYPYKSDTLYAERLGFGRNATGGDRSRVYRVTSLANSGTGTLRAGLESTDPNWIVFDIQGTIKLSSRIEVKSNKTVDGRGRSIVIEGGLLLGPGTRNVILSDFAISNRTTNQDAIEIRGNTSDPPTNLSTRNIWIHHVEAYDSDDGLIDITHAATDITISWCHFHSHIKALLVASDANHPLVDAAIRVTYHHNFFNKITRRGPQFRFGYADYFNNLQLEWYEFGAGSFSGAQFLSENNFYEARPGTFCVTGCPDKNPRSDANDFTVSKDGLINDWASMGLGNIRSVGDIATNNAKIVQHNPQQVFQRSTFYQATPEPATPALRQAILSGAGPRKTYCKP